MSKIITIQANISRALFAGETDIEISRDGKRRLYIAVTVSTLRRLGMIILNEQAIINIGNYRLSAVVDYEQTIGYLISKGLFSPK